MPTVDLTKRDEVASYLQMAESVRDWFRRAEDIRKANKQDLPPFYVEVVTTPEMKQFRAGLPA